MTVVVVGAGVIGLLTALECASAGARVQLVEQDRIPSPAATSYADQRVVRALHRGDVALTLAAAGLIERWAEVASFLDEPILCRTGVLTLAEAATVAEQQMLLERAGVRSVALTGPEVARRYPHLRVEPGRGGVLEPDAGVVRAATALHAIARRLGSGLPVQLLPGRTAVRLTGTGHVVLSDGEVLAGDSVIVAAGSWSTSLLPAATARQLTLQRQSVLDYRPGTAWSDSPVVIGLDADRPDAWLIPPVGDAPARLSAASACRAVRARADDRTGDSWRAHLIERFRPVLTDFDAGDVCGAADGYYLTDTSAGGPRLVQAGPASVWVYAACGGMSFKFAPLVARALADRARHRTPRPTGLFDVDTPGWLQLDPPVHEPIPHRGSRCSACAS